MRGSLGLRVRLLLSEPRSSCVKELSGLSAEIDDIAANQNREALRWQGSDFFTEAMSLAIGGSSFSLIDTGESSVEDFKASGLDIIPLISSPLVCSIARLRLRR